MKAKLTFAGWRRRNTPNAEIETGTDWLHSGLVLEGIVEIHKELQDELEYYEAEGKEAVFTLIKGD